MPEFQHLNLVRVVQKKPFVPGRGGGKKAQRTQYNLEHRQDHYNHLTTQISTIQQNWKAQLDERENAGFPDNLNRDIVPIFLQIDQAKDIESLKSFGIEIISEEEEGYILGANSDNLALFSDRLEQFLNQSNQKFKDSAAGIFELFTEPTERIKRILSPGLLEQWENLQNIPELSAFVAISSYLKIPDYPSQSDGQSDEAYQASIDRYKVRYQQWQEKKDELAMNRQTAFENFLRPYNAVFLGASIYVDFDDGFGCKLRISGQGLKDLALNFPFVFNIAEHDHLSSFEGTSELEELLQVEILSPEEDAPKICVIDSGIQEGHRLLAPAIDGARSFSYVLGDTDTFDKVPNGGHGTRVAGTALFPNGLGNVQEVQAPFWIQNARILNEDNSLHDHLNEVDLMTQIVNRFRPTKVFNLSVCNHKAQSWTHMPIWAAAIDKLIWENDILFCIAAGNIPRQSNNPDQPTILKFLNEGQVYPNYLKDEHCKITNPAHSCFALTVGSISHVAFENDDYACVSGKDLPSSFSRSGIGLWGMIKPDVVEYGGDFVISKPARDSITLRDETTPNLIRSTRDNGPAVGRDAVGTSFTTPKVTHIAAALQKLYLEESALLYRALIVQSARIPSIAESIDNFISHYGYGIPDISRASTNSTHRVTLYNTGKINPKNSNIYLVKIPNEINRPGLDYEVLVEITLSYKAEPRITRRKTHSYLSAWLDWETSRRGETQQQFSERVLASQNEDDDDDDGEEPETTPEPASAQSRLESFQWTIASKGKDGRLKGVKRQDSTVQKDWCYVRSNQLPDEFLVAVKGHRGWEKDLDKEIPYSVVVSFEVVNKEIEVDIYNAIRIENEVEIEQQIMSTTAQNPLT